MKIFNFWQKWLFIVGIFLVVFGLCLAFFGQSSLMDVIFNRNIDPNFWAGGELPENSSRFQAWIYGVLGSVIAGWGTLIAFCAFYPFKSREPWVWNGLAWCTGIWYGVDTVISALYGLTFNVILNTVILILLATPLVFTKRHFVK